ncbi:apurinic apyrimidinic endonuclease apn1 [Cryptosporidium ubiquitum]|uniref:Apurinic apyrimidinic endonuclease apn1 n=1 Tax=Cryptosporidium ubiquitum TaxID=857276 RepID=A0A1J4MLZ2_9CRYT|nr:apurinic apyrimidinic endonuclease apn1 [Cryptosporidium ubiquitum]OII74475.1 apurinic apyrimidinic endonuclease apn1 [Cryptosporidium ubiquitum]
MPNSPKKSSKRVIKEEKVEDKHGKNLKQAKLDIFSSVTKAELKIRDDLDHTFEGHKELAKKYRKFVGAHVSASGGVDKSVNNSVNIAGTAFSMFLKPSRGWNAPPLKQTTIDLFKKNCEINEIDYHKFCIPHGSYLINLGNPDEEKRSKMYIAFEDELKRCDALGIKLYNFHPGSTVGQCTKEESIKFISDCINKAHQQTHSVITVLENCAESKCVGYKFKELAEIIDKVKDKSRVGVCLDTCHLFAAGYDVRTAESFSKVMVEFEDVIGLKYLKAMHLNDSKGQFKSGLDRHENLGKGNIGMECFKFIMNDSRFNDIPLILETPDPNNDDRIYKKEIATLYDMLVQNEVNK